jgi:hypothetical protein
VNRTHVGEQNSEFGINRTTSGEKHEKELQYSVQNTKKKDGIFTFAQASRVDAEQDRIFVLLSKPAERAPNNNAHKIRF